MRIEHVWIPMSDGVRLAANLFFPDGAKSGEKFGAIFEYLPYRKDDWAHQRDYGLYAYFARRGFVGARVDIRGTGQSAGLPPDREYSEQEQKDGVQVIAWLARQPWSNGSVGMMGISWGGFNSIQLAMRRPPALKAIIAVDATDELFHDDIHYIDGMMHADEFELSMDQQIALPPAPEFSVREEILGPRFDNTPWFLLYLRQQRDGPFWRRASLRPHYDAIQIPVFLIGGFLDGYRDSIPRMMENLKSPVKALVGPWNHTYPHDAAPGPAIEWRDTAVRWWDRWLNGHENGIMAGPRLTVYMRRWYAPDLNLPIAPGEWRTEDWPPRNMREETMYLSGEHLLVRTAAQSVEHVLNYVPSAGVDGGFWWGDLTTDQRPADAFSLVYDSPPFEKDTAILGIPRAELQVSATAPLADWFVRLSDVAPDGTTTQVTGAGANGAQRESPSNPQPLEPGRTYPLKIEAHFTSWIFGRGHRLRLAVSNALWPMIWPTPHSMSTTLYVGGESPSRLVLPVVPAESASHPPQFPVPEIYEVPGVKSTGETWPGAWTIERDEVHESTQVNWRSEDFTEFPWGTERNQEALTYKVQDAHPETSSIHGDHVTTVDLRGRVLVWHGVLDLTSNKTHFLYHYKRELRENGHLIRGKSWEDTIPRDHQ